MPASADLKEAVDTINTDDGLVFRVHRPANLPSLTGAFTDPSGKMINYTEWGDHRVEYRVLDHRLLVDDGDYGLVKEGDRIDIHTDRVERNGVRVGPAGGDAARAAELVSTIDLDGVLIRVRHPADRACRYTSLVSGPGKTDFTADWGDPRIGFRVQDWRLSVEGRDYGVVQSGDRVFLRPGRVVKNHHWIEPKGVAKIAPVTKPPFTAGLLFAANDVEGVNTLHAEGLVFRVHRPANLPSLGGGFTDPLGKMVWYEEWGDHRVEYRVLDHRLLVDDRDYGPVKDGDEIDIHTDRVERNGVRVEPAGGDAARPAELVSTIDLDGVLIRVRHPADRACRYTSLVSGPGKTDFTADWGDPRIGFRVQDWRLSVEGRDYGVVQSGDRVFLRPGRVVKNHHWIEPKGVAKIATATKLTFPAGPLLAVNPVEGTDIINFENMVFRIHRLLNFPGFLGGFADPLGKMVWYSEWGDHWLEYRVLDHRLLVDDRDYGPVKYGDKIDIHTDRVEKNGVRVEPAGGDAARPAELVSTIDLDGVLIRVRHPADRACRYTSLVSGPGKTDFTADWGDPRIGFRVQDWRLSVDGRDYGVVQSGDHVFLRAGRVVKNRRWIEPNGGPATKTP